MTAKCCFWNFVSPKNGIRKIVFVVTFFCRFQSKFRCWQCGNVHPNNTQRDCIAYTIYRLIAVWFSIWSFAVFSFFFFLYYFFSFVLFISSSNNRRWIRLILNKQTKIENQMRICQFCISKMHSEHMGIDIIRLCIHAIFESIASHKCLLIYIAEAFFRLIESIACLPSYQQESKREIERLVKNEMGSIATLEWKGIKPKSNRRRQSYAQMFNWRL